MENRKFAYLPGSFEGALTGHRALGSIFHFKSLNSMGVVMSCPSTEQHLLSRGTSGSLVLLEKTENTECPVGERRCRYTWVCTRKILGLDNSLHHFLHYLFCHVARSSPRVVCTGERICHRTGTGWHQWLPSCITQRYVQVFTPTSTESSDSNEFMVVGSQAH